MPHGVTGWHWKRELREFEETPTGQKRSKRRIRFQIRRPRSSSSREIQSLATSSVSGPFSLSRG